jgi:hypothetical protein
MMIMRLLDICCKKLLAQFQGQRYCVIFRFSHSSRICLLLLLLLLLLLGDRGVGFLPVLVAE